MHTEKLRSERAGPVSSADRVLAPLVACPACRLPIALDLRCTGCGWHGVPGAFPDFVAEREVSDAEKAEMAAQSRAVVDYYENEEKLSCHWDRMSAADLPGLAGSPSGIVLDLGCGTGSAGAAFHASGATVVGADLSPACLDVARTRLDAVVRCNASHLPFRDDAFDAVIARGALHHLERPEEALAEAKRVMRPGATLLVLDPREFKWLEPIKHFIRQSDDSFTDDHHAYSVAEYRALIAREFDVEDVQTMHPFAILITVGLDLFPLPRALPKRAFTRRLLSFESSLNKTPLRSFGHLLSVRARKRA